MDKFVINGGKRLFGEIEVSGSKNAALALIFASLAIEGKTVLFGVPDIGDVRVALDMIKSLGANVELEGGRLEIDSTDLKYSPPDPALASKIRASTYLLGASLARFGSFELTTFGGCSFSSRPIDLHISAAEALGATMSESTLFAHHLHGGKISLAKSSVGTTVNSIIMATRATGTTEIYGFAKEPHVLTVISFFRAAGADISIESEKITVRPKPLHSLCFKVIGDMIEAGTYIVFALITGGAVNIKGVRTEELSSFLSIIREMGYTLNVGKSTVFALAEKAVANNDPICVNALPYPGFPTDLQPLIAPLLASSLGGTITDSVWQGRFGYLDALAKFGITSTRSGGSVLINRGIDRPASVDAPDLRGGAACIAAALSVRGVSEIYSTSIVFRGYEDIIEKLTSLGADIKLIQC